MLGQQDILNQLAGEKASITNCGLILNMNDPEQFEHGYRIAMQMRPCYTEDKYYSPTYHSINKAYTLKNARLMHDALNRLCIDIVYR